MNPLLSTLLGALAAVMILFNGELARHVGNYAASAFVHASGLALVVGVLVATRAETPFRRGVPAGLYVGGALGFLTVVFANRGFMSLGVSLTLSLGLLGQTVTAVLIDHFGWMGARAVPFHPGKAVSLALIGCGIAVLARA